MWLWSPGCFSRSKIMMIADWFVIQDCENWNVDAVLKDPKRVQPEVLRRITRSQCAVMKHKTHSNTTVINGKMPIVTTGQAFLRQPWWWIQQWTWQVLVDSFRNRQTRTTGGKRENPACRDDSHKNHSSADNMKNQICVYDHCGVEQEGHGVVTQFLIRNTYTTRQH